MRYCNYLFLNDNLLARLVSSGNFSILQHDLAWLPTGYAQPYPQALWTTGQALEIAVVPGAAEIV
jgi:hypothetical protein